MRFTVFDTTNSALTDNYISGLIGGRDGSLWVRTPETLYRYRAGTLQPLCAGSSIGLDSSPILEDRSGAIWSGDVGGVMVYAPNGKCSHHALDAAASGAVVTALLEQRDGSILIGTSRGLKQFRAGAITDAADLDVASTPVSALLVDRSGAIWIGSPACSSVAPATASGASTRQTACRAPRSRCSCRTRTAASGSAPTAMASGGFKATGSRH